MQHNLLYNCTTSPTGFTNLVDMPWLAYRAAVQYEKAEYDACIADCDKAVERGRELRADYKLIAKALSRKGNALVKNDELTEAISTYHKALTEHRCDTMRVSCIMKCVL